MAKTIALEIISPEGSIYKNDVDGVTLPEACGEITVFPDHTPLFAKLSEGEIIVMRGAERTSITVTGGFIDIDNNKLTVLADFAVRSAEIETKKVEEAMIAARDAIKRKQNEIEVQMAEQDLKKYIIELKMSEKFRKKARPSR